MENILTLQALTKTYGRLKAVDQLSFSIQKGNVYGILGPNGSGKSTTLGMVLQVVNKTSGAFSWFDGNLSTHEALKKVGAIIEHPNFYPYMTAHQNLKLVCKIKGVGFDRIDEKLELVGLIERKNSKFSTFSLGMKQRLAIASALLNNPEILILDEPTNGLDPQGIHQIREIIRKIAQSGTTILLASHLLDEVEKVCSHVVVLHRGKKLYSGAVRDMTASYGYFELASPQHQALKNLLSESESFSQIEEHEDTIKAFLTAPMEPALFNKQAFERGIHLSHLTTKRLSLEEQFLKLVQDTENQAQANT